MKKNLKKAVVLLLALVMALTPVQAFAVEKRYFYLSNTSQTRISMGAHDLDTNYQVIVANKKSATVQKVRYTVEDHGSDGYYYYLLPKKPEKPKITIKTTEGSGLLNWQFLKYKNPISSLKLGSTTIKGSKFDKKDCITLSYKKYANKNLKIKVVPKKGWGVNCYMSSEKRDQNPYMELADSFRPTKKGCNLRIEMWDKKRNTKENVDIIFK